MEFRGEEDSYTRGWVQAQLPEVVLINPKVSSDLADDLEVSFTPMKAVEAISGRVDLAESRAVSDVRKGYTAFADGDVIWAKITPCMENGKAAVMRGLRNGIGFGSTEFHVLRPNEPGVLAEWLFFFIVQQSVRRDAKNNMTGSAGQLRVPVGYVADMKIPLPSFVEQRTIVAKIEELFSELDNGIDQLQIIKQQLKQYRQAVLKAAFEGQLTAEWRAEQQAAGDLSDTDELLEQIKMEREERYQQQLQEWKQAVAEWEAAGGKESGRRKPGKPSCLIAASASASAHSKLVPSDFDVLPEGWLWLPLGTVGDVSGGLTKNPKRATLPHKFPYLRVANVYSNRLDLQEVDEIGVKEVEFERTLLVAGDLLFVEGNGSVDQIGRVAVWNGSIDPCVHQNHLIKCRPALREMAKYIMYWFLSPLGRNLIVREASSTSGLYTLSISKVSSLAVPVGTLAEQQQIVEEIESRFSVLDELEKAVELGLQQAEALRQSILKKAFEGRLLSEAELVEVRNDPEYEPADKLLERIKADKGRQGR